MSEKPNGNQEGAGMPLEDRLVLVRELIQNQYGVTHHTERYIFDLVKISSIVLGVISFIGLPQLLSFDSTNPFLTQISRSIGIAMIIYAVVCFVVILMGIWSAGGVNLRMLGRFKPSLWWFSDERFSNLNAKNDRSLWESLAPIYREIEEKLTKNPDEDTFHKETMTLLFLYLRADRQLKAARRMKGLLVVGMFMALGALMFGIATGLVLP